MAITKEILAHGTVKIAWLVTFPLIWVGLFTKGWFDFAYKGNPEAESLAFRNDYTAQYGLFGIDFETPEGIVRTGYSGWAVANSAHPNAYLSIHGSRVTAIISAVACILTAVTYLHSKKAPAEASVYIMGRCAWLATLDLALNLTTLGLWSITANSPAFNTVCEHQGCFALPTENVSNSTLSYTWGLLLVRVAFQILLAAAIVHMTLAKRASVKFCTEEHEGHYTEPSAPGLEVSLDKAAV
ncbi:hypothetical protein NSK_001825 [Nannochloropsis salina CCMP1776]|uniref:MARVEL domain-containing protein n=1 Tax=Nannochloropsis salina CCMP1776 TaxID=1027361 RepID=A0A4D9D8N4_9STRA|nr:hypothetical protein NSK_001825 [Nannochloropsis salina CCMP1776]|eukprot:TFJ86737.1 hypothetical protein NSK_001825 [Nannochloropsis salina CCMP1776]